MARKRYTQHRGFGIAEMEIYSAVLNNINEISGKE